MKKIFLWVGMSYSLLTNAQLVLKSGVTAATSTNNNSLFTNGKLKIGALTNGTLPTADPATVLEVNGDVKVNLADPQSFAITGTKTVATNVYAYHNLSFAYSGLSLVASGAGASFSYNLGNNFSFTSGGGGSMVFNLGNISSSIGFMQTSASGLGLSANTPLMHIKNTNSAGSLAFSTNNTDRLTIKSNGDLETTSEYQKLLFGAVSPSQSQPGYITGDDQSAKKILIYHPSAIRLTNNAVVPNPSNVSDGLYVSNGNKIGINAFPVERVHANVIGSCARFDCAVANSTALSPEENRERVYIGRDNKMAISFIPMSSNNSWIHMHHTLNDGLQISTGPYVGTNPLVTFKANGKVGIGTTNPLYSLHVKGITNGYVAAFDGKVRMRSLKCDQTSWADDVFDEKYELMKLDSLDAYIKQNKHLPGIPTTETVQKEGVDITEMNEKFLRRLEENTLYLLELKKENDLLKAELLQIKSQLNTK